MSALFSVIGRINPDSKFLDLFAGTGRVGFEALKRGAASVVFVESVRDRAEAIRENLRDDSDPDSVLVLSLEIRRALSWLSKRDMKFDYVFADPPYNSGWCETFASLKNLDKILSDDCVIILEHSVREKFALNNNPYNLEILQEKIYGETCLTFLRKQITNQE